MIRLFLRLFGIKDFETCQSCETLKQQLNYEREEIKRLTDTLLNIIQPKVIESAPVEINPIQQAAALFSRRRSALEARDRAEAQILKEKKYLGMPDRQINQFNKLGNQINELESELGFNRAEEKREV